MIEKTSPLFIFHKGSIIPGDQPCFSAFEPALQFGLGVFTSVRVSQGRPENLMRHVARLKRDCAELEIVFPSIQITQIDSLIDANQARLGVWRLKIFVTKGVGANLTMTLTPYVCTRSSYYALGIFPTPVVVPTAKIKTIAYAHRFLIKEYAHQQECADALTLDSSGKILETAFSNFFWVFEGCLYVPAFHLPFLQGTFLMALIDWAKKTNCPIREVEFAPSEIPDGAILFVCNALTHLQAVDAIEKRSFLRNPKLEAKLLRGAFEMFQDLF